MTSQSVAVRLSFGPDAGLGPSKLLLVVSAEEGVAVWKVKRCGQERRLMREPDLSAAVKAAMADDAVLSVAWQHTSKLFILNRDNRLLMVGGVCE